MEGGESCFNQVTEMSLGNGKCTFPQVAAEQHSISGPHQENSTGRIPGIWEVHKSKAWNILLHVQHYFSDLAAKGSTAFYNGVFKS